MRPAQHTSDEQLTLFDAPRMEEAPSRPKRRRRARRRPRAGFRLPLTLLALGVATAGIVSGSFAAWTSQKSNTNNAVTAGTLTMTNNKNATSVFSASNIIPGQTGSGTVTVANSGSVPMTVKLTQDTLSTSGIETSLRMSIHDDTRNWCYWPATGSGPCATNAAWDGTATLTSLTIPSTAGAGQWPSGESHTYTISWELLASSPNSDQGKTGSFRLVWDGTS